MEYRSVDGVMDGYTMVYIDTKMRPDEFFPKEMRAKDKSCIFVAGRIVFPEWEVLEIMKKQNSFVWP